jgi:hypothetical protein
MEWTASAPVAATSHVSAPEPPNYPEQNNDDSEDAPMRETTEETKQRKQPGTQRNKQQQRNKENRVHWGENVVHVAENDRKNNKYSEGLKETQQEMIWVPKVTTGEATAATTNALAAKTPGVTEAPKTMKQEATTNKTKATEEMKQPTATTATPQRPKRTTTTDAPKKATKEVKQQLPVQPGESKKKTQSGTGSRTHDRENRTNVVSNKERRNVNR